MSELWAYLGITGAGALSVVIASTVLYVGYSALLSAWGPRLFLSPSTLSLSLLTVLGAVSARAMLGHFPTLGGATVAILTLVLLEAVLGRMRQASRAATVSRRRGRIRRRHRPIVVMVDGQVVARTLTTVRLTEDELYARLRQSGLRHREDAALVIVEARGTLTIVHRGTTIDPALLADVRGAAQLPGHLIQDRGDPEL